MSDVEDLIYVLAAKEELLLEVLLIKPTDSIPCLCQQLSHCIVTLLSCPVLDTYKLNQCMFKTGFLKNVLLRPFTL